MSKLFNLNLRNIVSAVVSAVLSAVLMYLSNLTSITDMDLKKVLGIATLVGLTSLLKAFTTNEKGDFATVLPTR